MVWIVFHSQTQAIQCRNMLAQNGIIGQLGKPPRTNNHQASCTWAVGIHWEEQSKSRQICKAYGIHPCAWMDGTGGAL